MALQLTRGRNVEEVDLGVPRTGSSTTSARFVAGLQRKVPLPDKELNMSGVISALPDRLWPQPERHRERLAQTSVFVLR